MAVSRAPCRGLGGVTSVFLPPWFQERLLLSLLPAHIAMEMKAEIIQRLQGPKAGQVENTNNFHNLYVKRHTNVRCAAPPPPRRGCGARPGRPRHVASEVLILAQRAVCAARARAPGPPARSAEETGLSTCCVLGPAITKGREVAGGAFILGTLRSGLPGSQEPGTRNLSKIRESVGSRHKDWFLKMALAGAGSQGASAFPGGWVPCCPSGMGGRVALWVWPVPAS